MGQCCSSDKAWRYTSMGRGRRDRFRREALTAHNNYRVKHGSPPLRLAGKMNSYAQKWAERCAKSGQQKHRSSNKYGENIYWFYNSSGLHGLSGEQAVESFYNEIAKYDFNKGEFTQGTGHFTQVVWKDSVRLGVGMAINSKKPNEVYAVFNYDPPGNVIGRFKENVFRPRS
ncbi:Golgi-associated plant pathogenesis-related protein 1-like [Anneissia japonica]|uniref:Golgi-associated plant pathogenesis-related protein 1-like n=1 Tax=Anneissia japonica TaxID=1529436 RepID=UPI0014256A0B|nr:Golgi-associated plant pathogenesis-related protein 1-like [Anneissia japonica]